jgi:hypothetical protein
MSDETPTEESGVGEIPGKPGARKKTTGEVMGISKSERVRNYLIGIGALTGLILGLFSQFKGEPIAERTWKTLRRQVNKQSEIINRLHIRMVAFQAAQEARTAFELEGKLDALQKKYDALLAKQGSQKPTQSPVSVKPAAPAPPKCSAGHVVDARGRCRAVHKAVAAKVQADQKRAVSAQKALEAEKRKRLEAERRKKELMRKLIRQTKAKAAPRPLKALPDKLDEASK